MAGHEGAMLLSLPDELLLEIISHLSLIASEHQMASSQEQYFKSWTLRHQECIRIDTFVFNDMKGISSSCRRFHSLMNPLLFNNLVSRFSGQTVILTHLAVSPALKHNMTSISIAYTSMEDMRVLFKLPRLENMIISDFDYGVSYEDTDEEDETDEDEETEDGDSSQASTSESSSINIEIGVSTVKRLDLPGCKAGDYAVAKLAGWPAALEEFYMEVEEAYPGEMHDGDTLAFYLDVGQALRRHRHTLQTLCLTRPFSSLQRHYRSELCDELDFKPFVALQTLRLCYYFLCCDGEVVRNIFKLLPPSLEILEVYYDDFERAHFLAEEDVSEQWLKDIAKNKACVPSLREIKIHSPGSVDGWAGIGCGMGETEVWKAPSSLAQAFAEADIKLTVLLTRNDRYQLLAY